MQEQYLTIKEDGIHEIEIKKSRFICSLKRVTTEEEAKAFIAQIKKDHWKASHNCSAFIIGSRSEIQRSSDDGEPSGTAGIPMLEVLKKNDLINVVAVVTRYFGGTKLGAGGLIRAYGQSVSQALTEIGLVQGKQQQELILTIDYTNLGKAQNFIENSDYFLKDILYEERVKLICLIDVPLVDHFIEEMTQQLNGQLTVEAGAISYQELPYVKK